MHEHLPSIWTSYPLSSKSTGGHLMSTLWCARWCRSKNVWCLQCPVYLHQPPKYATSHQTRVQRTGGFNHVSNRGLNNMTLFSCCSAWQQFFSNKCQGCELASARLVACHACPHHSSSSITSRLQAASGYTAPLVMPTSKAFHSVFLASCGFVGLSSTQYTAQTHHLLSITPTLESSPALALLPVTAHPTLRPTRTVESARQYRLPQRQTQRLTWPHQAATKWVPSPPGQLGSQQNWRTFKLRWISSASGGAGRLVDPPQVDPPQVDPPLQQWTQQLLRRRTLCPHKTCRMPQDPSMVTWLLALLTMLLLCFCCLHFVSTPCGCIITCLQCVIIRLCHGEPET